MGEILIGTSGFSYDDWRGPFYPDKTKSGDMLAYYARRFPVVEVNSTYYAIPAPTMFARMIEKTPRSFEFVVKAHKDITHAEQTDLGAVSRFLDAIQPATECGRLGCVLAQFPWGFKNEPGNLDRVTDLHERMGGVPIVVEFRNAGWVTDEVFDVLRARDLGFCCVDEPHLKGLMPPVVTATSSLGYVRFHGRNAGKWWKHEEAWERYNYLYSRDELAEWIPRVAEISSSADKTYVFFNNHYKGNAPTNAQLFAQMLDVPLTSGPEAVGGEGGQASLFG